MEEKIENPLAFPNMEVQSYPQGDNMMRREVYHLGMTMLDKFADTALLAILSQNPAMPSYEELAKKSYEIAKYMLKERAKMNQNG